MNIGIDLRGLNYMPLTGINTYTIHFLYCLSNIKYNHPNMHFTAIGLQSDVYDKISLEYPFIYKLFERRITTSQYFGFQKLAIPQLLLSIFTIFKIRVTKNLNWANCISFDLILQPQPKPLLKNEKSNLLVVFHDIYSAINTSTMSFKQRILENAYSYRIIAKASRYIFANSISTAMDLKNLLKIEEFKIQLVYPAKPIWKAFSNKQVQPKYNKTIIPSERYMLCVSGIEPRKNWINILKAFKYTQQKNDSSGYHLVLVGRIVDEKYYKTLILLIKSLDIKNVTFHLDLNQEEKHELYQNCDFLLYPSFYEGFGFPIIEALEYEKPVITSKISSMPELAKESGLYVNPLNYLEIASAMEILQKDRMFYQYLVNSIDVDKIKYSWNELEIALEKILKFDEI
ncbi:MAG: glycosyltransferase family 4 protein [candidate division SR1 bacterium]|nr:glycosyltransferase family 4 protein [candidate division SR1 bacterium]